MTNLDIVATAKRCLELDKEFRAEDWPSIITRVKRLGIPFKLGNAAPILAEALIEAIEYLELIADRMPSCSCMDTPNLAREALAKMGVKP